MITKNYLKNRSDYNHNYIKIINFIPYNIMADKYTKLSNTDSIKIDYTFKRYYPYSNLTAHIVGYIGKSNKKDNQLNKIVKRIGKNWKNWIGKTI